MALFLARFFWRSEAILFNSVNSLAVEGVFLRSEAILFNYSKMFLVKLHDILSFWIKTWHILWSLRDRMCHSAAKLYFSSWYIVRATGMRFYRTSMLQSSFERILLKFFRKNKIFAENTIFMHFWSRSVTLTAGLGCDDIEYMLDFFKNVPENFHTTGIPHGGQIWPDFGSERLWQVRGDVADLSWPYPDGFWQLFFSVSEGHFWSIFEG